MTVAKLPADVDRLFAEALSAGDLEAAVAVYDVDACFDNGSGSPAYGHEQIRAGLDALIEQKPTLNCYEIDVVDNGGLAVLWARWIYTGTGADSERFESQGRGIEVARRQSDGSWNPTIDPPNGAN